MGMISYTDSQISLCLFGEMVCKLPDVPMVKVQGWGSVSIQVLSPQSPEDPTVPRFFTRFQRVGGI